MCNASSFFDQVSIKFTDIPMENSVHSTIPHEIIEALRSHNPFDRPAVVKSQNIWGDSFADIDHFNAHASDAILKMLDRVEKTDSSLDKVLTAVITAERGVGKTHLIRRVRKRSQSLGNTIFVYASADEYGDLDFINSAFLRSFAESLDKPISDGVTQWQIIGYSMIRDVLKSTKPSANPPSPEEMVDKFDYFFESNLKRGKNLVADITKAVRRVRPESDPYIIRAIIWTLSEERGALAVKWLAGEALEIQDSVDLRLPVNDRSEKERESNALSSVTKIISLIGEYKKVLICFDELDVSSCNSFGYPAQLVILDLARKIFDLVRQSKQSFGVVIITALLRDAWRAVEQDQIASIEKICTAYPKPISLNYISPETIEDLVTLWLRDLYQAKDFQPPTPIYPFEKDELIQFAKGKPDVRETLKWCSEALVKKLDTISPPPEKRSPVERLKEGYEKSIDQFSKDFLDDNQLIAEVLRFHFDKISSIEKLRGISIENVVVSSTEDVTPKHKSSGYLQFKIIAEENNKELSIAVGVMQQTSGLSVGAGFKRLLDNKQFKFNRGCMVRSKERKLKRNWDSYQYYQDLIAKGGEWVDLKEEEFKPLFAIKYMYDNCDQFDLTTKRLDSLKFVYDSISQNPLIKEILSNPEGQIHQEFLEGHEVKHLHSEEESEQIIASIGDPLSDEINDNEAEQIDLSMLEVK